MRRKGIVVSFLLLISVFMLSACSAESILEEIPSRVRLDKEIISLLESEEEIPVRESFLEETASTYAYERLSPAQQIWYRDIEQGLGNMQEKIELSEEGLEAGLDEDCIDLVFQSVLIDHPEIFYVDGYTYTTYTRGNSTVSVFFSGKYVVTPEEAQVRNAEIEQAAEAVLAGIDSQAAEYDKVKYVYDTIIKNTDYELDAPDNQNIYSVFVGKESVCQGYAKAAQYLLNRLGMECTLVQGTVDSGEGHAWNLVRVDGSYYYMDATWGDASYLNAEGEALNAGYMPEINYDYLCITTEQLCRTHVAEEVVALPECTDTAANYYVRENAIFYSYDREQMKQLFQRAAENGQSDVTVKCGDAECFAQIRTALLDNQEIFDYLADGGDSITYACNVKQLSLTFWMTNP